MTERQPGSEDQPPDHFLVDGVAPAVIGGGPPEAPIEPDPPGRHRAHADGPPQPHGPTPRGPGAPPLPGQPGGPPMANSGPPYGQPAPGQHYTGQLTSAHYSTGQPTTGQHFAGEPAPGQYPAGQPTQGQHAGQPSPGQHLDPRHGHEPAPYSEPPTSPIPVVEPHSYESEPEKRRSWASKIFRLPGS